MHLRFGGAHRVIFEGVDGLGGHAAAQGTSLDIGAYQGMGCHYGFVPDPNPGQQGGPEADPSPGSDPDGLAAAWVYFF